MENTKNLYLPQTYTGIQQLWRQKIPDCGETLCREIVDAPYNVVWKLMFNAQRMERRFLPKKALLVCPFCSSNEESERFMGKFNSLMVFGNQYPISPMHLLLFSNLHDTDPSKIEIKDLLEFSITYPEFRVLLSIRPGSGASIPSHIHTHAFNFSLPIESAQEINKILTPKTTLSQLIYPAFTIKVNYKDINPVSELLINLINKYSDIPFNFSFVNRSIYILPRKIESPQICSAIVDGVGSLETAGVYTIVSESAMDLVNLKTFRIGLNQSSYSSDIGFQRELIGFLRDSMASTCKLYI